MKLTVLFVIVNSLSVVAFSGLSRAEHRSDSTQLLGSIAGNWHSTSGHVVDVNDSSCVTDLPG